MQKGKASIKFDKEPVIMGAASIVGEKEGEGPLKSCFDRVEPDPMYGQDSWEAAESEFQRQTALKCLEKSGLKESDIRYLFAGDLLGQIVATSFGVQDLEIPVFGLYGACSTMGEAIMLASMTVNAGYADRVMALASSHFASAERQFRFPLAYAAALLCMFVGGKVLGLAGIFLFPIGATVLFELSEDGTIQLFK